MVKVSSLESKFCTGCGACYNICPKKAISMETNTEGFLFPHISAECIDCGLCGKVCPQLNKEAFEKTKPSCYAVICKDKYRDITSSGGVFAALANRCLDNGGAVIGAAFTEDFSKVQHISIHSKADLSKILKSKYVQSDTKRIFTEVKELLQMNKEVLFAGCPCQVDGLKKFLGKDYDNLLTVDILCHGVPSPLAYKKFLEEVCSGRVPEGVDFRDKKYGWGTLLSVKFRNDIHYDYYNGIYFSSFLSGMSMREACFHCRYACPERVGDITLGDFWGIKNSFPEMDDGKGTSFIMCNTEKGEKAFSAVSDTFSVKKDIPMKTALAISEKANGALLRPTAMPSNRKCFFNHLQKGEKFSVAYRYATTALLDVGILGWWIETPKSNYGSTLTNFGLYKYLLSLGLSVAFVSPPNFDRKYAGEFNKQNSYRMTAKYDYPDMKENNKYIDTFIVASDVLWYYDAFIKTGYFFMLDFVNDEKKKISYATSFGNTSRFFPKEEMLKAKSLLKRFDAISVREYEGVDICKERFNVEATQVLDPVFLCDTKEWIKLAEKAERKTTGKFLFAYILDPNEEKVKKLDKLAKAKSLKLVTITDKQFNAEEKTSILEKHGLLKSATIEELLYHLLNASFVVTDSYHGMCFSIILRKSFIVVVNRARGASRFDTLGTDLNLSHRMIESFNELETNPNVSKDIDYKDYSDKIESEIKRSKEWLSSALNKKKTLQAFSEIDLLTEEFLKLREEIQGLKTEIEKLKK